MIADVVVDLQYGDCGKGKVTHHLLKSGEYTHCIRYNGGCNAGHTIFHQGRKFVTHHIPAGVFFGIKSIIGPGCVVNLEQFFNEIYDLQEADIETTGMVFIASNAHIITTDHLEEDGKDTKIGTTKRGNGPAYRDKYGRTGLRAGDIPELERYVIDVYDELHNKSTNPVILFEGAQGFGLDIDWGDYPYVTSSHCTVGSAILNGVPPQAVRKVYGVAKGYETYVGTKNFEPQDETEIFSKLREVGKEYGATTGRPRQCNWMDLQLLKKAMRINGVTHLVMNKMDVLRETGTWKMRDKSTLYDYLSDGAFCERIKQEALQCGVKNVSFSYSPEYI
jgi:adenylosuccinate synthase